MITLEGSGEETEVEAFNREVGKAKLQAFVVRG
jgi:hypothetical protein